MKLGEKYKIIPIICFGYGIEFLLPSCIPEHKPNILPMNPQLFFKKIHTNRLLIAFCEGSAAIALDHA